FGTLAALAGGRRAWFLTGFLGGLTAATPLLSGGSFFANWQSTVLVALPAVIGGAVGTLAEIGIRRGQSRLPGVKRLVVALERADQQRAAGLERHATAAGDLVPAAAPDRRGSEPSALA